MLPPVPTTPLTTRENSSPASYLHHLSTSSFSLLSRCSGRKVRISIAAVAVLTELVASDISASQCSQPAEGSKSVISIDADRLQRRVRLGDPVLLRVRMTNVSRHDVSIWLAKGSGEDQYEVDVRDQKRNLPPDTEYGKKRNGHVHLEMLKVQDLVGSGDCVPLRARKSIVHEIDVSKLYDLSTPGKYFIRVQRADPESFAMLKSNTVRITVAP
jgi:hypothetical protein